MTRERTYGISQPRTVRQTCGAVHLRGPIGLSRSGTLSSFGCCGKTGTGSVAAFDAGGIGGLAADWRSMSCSVESMRNFGGADGSTSTSGLSENFPDLEDAAHALQTGDQLAQTRYVAQRVVRELEGNTRCEVRAQISATVSTART